MKGTIYLIHFDRPLHHARHYLGWTSNLQARLESHLDGNGARLMAAVGRAGVGWRLVRAWSGDRARERKMKNQKNTPRAFCPVC